MTVRVKKKILQNSKHFHYVAILDPNSRPKGNEFYNLGRGFHRKQNRAVSLSPLLWKYRRFSKIKYI